MMFAIITPALITGAFANRIHFKAYVIFLIAWLTFVYVPWCHWIWGGGFLAKWGVLDFAGGIVVHATAGFASLASVNFVGSRAVRESEPHSVPLVALGTGLLWFGWYGFNAGSALSASPITALAFFNTDLAGSFAAVTWLIMEWSFAKKPKFIGLLTGAVAGLATITPGAGYIPPWAACIEGILAAIVCYSAVWFKNKMKWDDALDVWGVHGVGGILGTILLGCFGSTEYNPLGADGLFFGGGAFFGKQIAAVVFACVWGYVFTWGMLWLINKVTPVKINEEVQDNLDQTELGEKAYVKPGSIFVQRTSGF
jgi:Amt family ammonium transporter